GGAVVVAEHDHCGHGLVERRGVAAALPLVAVDEAALEARHLGEALVSGEVALREALDGEVPSAEAGDARVGQEHEGAGLVRRARLLRQRVELEASEADAPEQERQWTDRADRKSTRLNYSHGS